MITKRIKLTHGCVPGIVLIGLAAALWGTGGAAAKQLLMVSSLDPIEVGFYRLSISALALLAASLLLGRYSTLHIRPQHIRPIATLALATALYQVFFYNAVAIAGVTVATLITICLAPLIVALLAKRVLKEYLDKRTKLVMYTTLSGTILLIGWPVKGSLNGDNFLLGVVLALFAAASYSGMVLASRHLAQHYDAFQLIIISFSSGAILLLPIVAFEGFARPATVETIYLIIFLGLVPTALAYVLFFIGIKTTSATASSIVSLLEPLVATILGLVIFHEKIGLAGSVGGLLMIAGLLFLRDRSADTSKEGQKYMVQKWRGK